MAIYYVERRASTTASDESVEEGFRVTNYFDIHFSDVDTESLQRELGGGEIIKWRKATSEESSAYYSAHQAGFREGLIHVLNSNSKRSQPNDQAKDEWLLFGQISKELKIPERTLRHYQSLGQFPNVYRFGSRHMRIKRSEYEAWVAQSLEEKPYVNLRKKLNG
jgi:predicted DNA-binding transcriptional regulator AlpA